MVTGLCQASAVLEKQQGGRTLQDGCGDPEALLSFLWGALGSKLGLRRPMGQTYPLRVRGLQDER